MRAALVVCALAGVVAADSKPIAGSWAGEIEIPGQKLAITITFDGADGGLIDIPQQHATGLPLTHVAVTGTHVAFELAPVHATFEGDLAHGAIAGTMKQGGMALPFRLAPTAAIQRVTYKVPPAPRTPLTARVGHALLGTWSGTSGGDAQVTVRFEEHDGLVTGTVANHRLCEPPSPITGLTLTFDKLHVENVFPDGVNTYVDGTIAGDAISGTVFRAGVTEPFVLHRDPPAPPVPWREVEVAIPSSHGTVLAGTLRLPGPGTAYPVVVTVTGSGPQDRDECLLGIRPFRQLAETLAKRGIATLRYDDRGTAKSTGDFKTATAADFADDAQAAVAWLRAQSQTARIGILGHSEGGLIAPMVAARDPQVDFIVMWAGPGVPLDEVIMKQSHDIGLAEGTAASAVARADRISALTWKAFRAAKDQAAFKAALTASLTALPPADRAEVTDIPAFVDASLQQLWTPWFRWYNHYDPAKTLAKVTVPVLAINGGMDRQVDAKTNLAVIKRALAKNKDVTILELPGLNHIFQHTSTGAVSEYAKNPPLLDAAVLDATADWIALHTRVKSAP